jgi:hypothetical protein
MNPGGRRSVVLASLAVLALVALTVALASGGGEAQGSSVSRGPSGWLAARKYLEARGAEVTLWREPLDRFSGDGVLVVAFPWQHGKLLDAAELIEAHLQRGGHVVLAWSGASNNAWEMVVLEELGLAPEEVREAPLNPFTWRKFVREEWDLRPSQGQQRQQGQQGQQEKNTLPSLETLPSLGGGAIRVWAPRHMPELPENPEVLYRTPSGRPAVVCLKRHKGSLWLLPVDALANARLSEAGNADLLETLLARLGRTWTFDEYHHGLVAVEAEGEKAFGRILDLVLIHLAVLYGLAVLTLSRRFGPPWKEPPVVTGSVSSFLVGLGALHHRMRHHAEAARRLLERTRELAPDLTLPDDLARRADTAGPRDLVEVARTVAQLRRGTRSTPSGDRT